MKQLLIGLIRLYQHTLSPDHGWFSVVTRRTCRFEPTCSHYMISAIENRGIITGIWIGLKRIIRCHPWHPGGYDPIPGKK